MNTHFLHTIEKEKDYIWLLPKNSTFKTKNAIIIDIPNPVVNGTVKTIPVGIKYPCLATCYYYFNKIWRRGFLEGIANNSANNVYGIDVSYPGNGNLYLTTGGYALSSGRNTGTAPPTPEVVYSAETIVLLKILR